MKAQILDTRDLAKRKEELEELRDALEVAREKRADLSDTSGSTQEELDEADAAVESAEADFGEDEREELKALEELESEVAERRNGNTLIPESEFTDYCKDMLEDIGDLPKDLPRYIVIDWEATADNLKADYSEVDFQGTTYLYRA